MPTVPETKRQIEESLRAIRTQPLRAVAMALWRTLGYSSDRTLVLRTKGDFRQYFDPEGKLNETSALWADWQEVEFLFQLTDDDLNTGGATRSLFESSARVDNTRIHSYVFFAIRLREPHRRHGERKDKPYTRTELVGIARAVNRLLPMPALILFIHGNTLTLSVVNRRLHKREETKDVLEKVTVIKDVDLARPHRAHLDILHDLSLGALYDRHHFSDFVGLHRAWAKTLDSAELNKRFYLDIANWFFWAARHAEFPRPAHLTNAKAYQSLSLIRLITRVVFCWFLKEKGLIPGELFQESRLPDILTDLDSKKSTFYHAILQNLFFATLSVPMEERRFIGKAFQGKSRDYGKQYVYRFKDELRPEKMAELFGGVPFLNGGLFECLDIVPSDEEPDIEEVRIDGFSSKPHKQPKVPNFLFFGPPHTEDLRDDYGNELRFSQVPVLPLIEIFERYKFTVAENTPVEEEVALDPELLGLVFENLLASFNDETKSTARKQTGAFYTPRVVVDYMVDEALIAHFKETLGDTPDTEARLRKLFSYAEENNPFDPAETARLLDAIDSGDSTVKILDPACGSGAFPMGILHRLVFLLRRLDPGNAAFRARQVARVRSLDVGREAAEEKLKEAFARHEDDYARKVYLIEHCIYGVDINPIAVQIAKLRFFISLLVDQETSDTRENRGVLPLPNLETKFVAANTLFALRRRGQTLLISRDVRAKTAELLRVRHEHFNARHWQEKRALRRKDKKLREEIAGLLGENQIVPTKEAEDLASWNPYSPNESANFFDPEWMFALDAARLSKPAATTLRDNFALINEVGGQTELIPQARPTESGFDIVIGNPPYVRQEEIKESKPKLKEQYHCYTGVADLYVYFYERSFDLLRLGGMLCFISSNKYFRADYGQRLRHFIASAGQISSIIDFGDAPVFTAIAYPSIIIVRKAHQTREKGLLPNPPVSMAKWLTVAPKGELRALIWNAKPSPGLDDFEPSVSKFPEVFTERSFVVSQLSLAPTGWQLQNPTASRLLEKIRGAGRPLCEIARIYNGIKTGFNDAFVVDSATRERLIKEQPNSAKLFKKFVRGRDVKRWRLAPQSLWLIYIPWHFPIQDDLTINAASSKAESEFQKQYLPIYRHLSKFKRELAARDKSETGIRYEWYALARPRYESCQEFLNPKVVIPTIEKDVAYAPDFDSYFGNDKTSICVHPNVPLFTSLLNSKVLWWVIRKTAATKQGGFYEFKPTYVSKLPIPTISGDVERALESRAKKIIEAKRENANAFIANIEAEIDGLIAHLYGLNESEFNTILDELELPDPTRVATVEAYHDAAKGLLK